MNIFPSTDQGDLWATPEQRDMRRLLDELRPLVKKIADLEARRAGLAVHFKGDAHRERFNALSAELKPLLERRGAIYKEAAEKRYIS